MDSLDSALIPLYASFHEVEESEQQVDTKESFAPSEWLTSLPGIAMSCKICQMESHICMTDSRCLLWSIKLDPGACSHNLMYYLNCLRVLVNFPFFLLKFGNLVWHLLSNGSLGIVLNLFCFALIQVLNPALI